MASISLYRYSGKAPGPVRFRLSDGRGVCLYWTGLLQKHDDAEIETCKQQISDAYKLMLEEGSPLTSKTLRAVIDKRAGEFQKAGAPPLVDRYRAFVNQAYEGGFIGEQRYKQCCAILSFSISYTYNS